MVTCDKCNGEGHISTQLQWNWWKGMLPLPSFRAVCPDCRGEGVREASPEFMKRFREEAEFLQEEARFNYQERRKERGDAARERIAARAAGREPIAAPDRVRRRGPHLTCTDCGMEIRQEEEELLQQTSYLYDGSFCPRCNNHYCSACAKKRGHSCCSGSTALLRVAH